MTPTEILTDFYNRAPTALELALYDALKGMLNRDPEMNEIGNMKTDSNLVTSVLANL